MQSVSQLQKLPCTPQRPSHSVVQEPGLPNFMLFIEAGARTKKRCASDYGAV
jgi:hypothetical protein